MGGEKKKKKRKPRVRNAPTEKLDETCNNYLEGRCRYGDDCRRKHVGDVHKKWKRSTKSATTSSKAGADSARCAVDSILQTKRLLKAATKQAPTASRAYTHAHGLAHWVHCIHYTITPVIRRLKIQ